MPDQTECHCTDDHLERYSLGRLASSEMPALEEHLLVCPRCTSRLARMEPYNFVHFTADGPIYSRITRLRQGTFFARHWGRSLSGGKQFQSRQGARAYLVRTFALMFPEHVCSRRCGKTQAPGS